MPIFVTVVFFNQGRNKVAIEVITRTREYFTWEVAFLGLRSEVLPDRMRAAFSDLLIGELADIAFKGDASA